jgi:hypothetical protein
MAMIRIQSSISEIVELKEKEIVEHGRVCVEGDETK